MKIKADWVDKELSKIIVRARYDSQWTDVVDKNIAKRSLKLGIECAISENVFLIDFYEREIVNYKENEKKELINEFINQLKKTNERLRIIAE